MSNVPELDFRIIEHLIAAYRSPQWIKPLPGGDDVRTERFLLEQEASTLLFLGDEIEELKKHAISRLQYIEDQLDDEV